MVGYATGATYASRYAAIIFPFCILLAALGIDRLRSRPVVAASLASLLVLGGVGGVRNVVDDRSDARRTVDAIEAKGSPGDVVAYCPDQLGPSTSRSCSRSSTRSRTPRSRHRSGSTGSTTRSGSPPPTRGVRPPVAGAAPATTAIFFVYSTNYLTHREICPQVLDALGRARVPEVLSRPVRRVRAGLGGGLGAGAR